jgi:hypothetical protein
VIDNASFHHGGRIRELVEAGVVGFCTYLLTLRISIGLRSVGLG